ncbi:MAG: 6-carboxytetrahydropterin synthase [Streptococcaceae bacterium]|jgi:6-pyruvoyltetrahydropterin/6-carboxytetrahydropterin synthase|nr:6-carboxytetrahydropterin synthase [Streptococcaceae bacterium]
MKISKRFSFDASHQLVGHEGKCANLHGHTYQLEVCLNGQIKQEQGSDQGMVYDFGHLKSLVQAEILSHFDHAVILQGNEPIASLVETKRAVLGFRTTAENMSLYMAYLIQKGLADGVELEYVRLWETGSSYAEAESADLLGVNLGTFDAVRFYD